MSTLPMANISYFKRYRMELDLLAPLSPVPDLPAGYSWLPWHDELLETHARVKHEIFRNEIDGIVFPNLSNIDGCRRLMREIRDRPGFRKEATWLITTGDEHVATVQGVSDRAGTGGIQNFGIIPSHRGRGLSVPLLLQALQGFRTAGLMRASLEVTAQNAAAIALYRRFGFRFRKTIYKMVDHSTVSFAPSAGAADWCV